MIKGPTLIVHNDVTLLFLAFASYFEDYMIVLGDVVDDDDTLRPCLEHYLQSEERQK